MLISAELRGFVTWFIHFLGLLWVRCNCAKFHHCRICSPRNSPRQSAIDEDIAEVNSVFRVITLVKILLRWLFPSKIYIQFTIFNTYFSKKIMVYKQEILLACAREASICVTRSQVNHIFSAVYSSSFSLFTWQWAKLCFHVLYSCISKIL